MLPFLYPNTIAGINHTFVAGRSSKSYTGEQSWLNGQCLCSLDVQRGYVRGVEPVSGFGDHSFRHRQRGDKSWKLGQRQKSTLEGVNDQMLRPGFYQPHRHISPEHRSSTTTSSSYSHYSTDTRRCLSCLRTKHPVWHGYA